VVSQITVLQARAAREYGIPWEQFPYLTPSELAAIAKDYRQSWVTEQKLADARAAKTIAAIYTAAGAKDVKAEDWMPEYEGDQPKRKNQTNEEMIDTFKAVFGMLGG